MPAACDHSYIAVVQGMRCYHCFAFNLSEPCASACSLLVVDRTPVMKFSNIAHNGTTVANALSYMSACAAGVAGSFTAAELATARRCLGSGARVEADSTVQNHRGPQPVRAPGPETADPQGYLGGFRLRALAAGATIAFLHLRVYFWCGVHRAQCGEVLGYAARLIKRT